MQESEATTNESVVFSLIDHVISFKNTSLSDQFKKHMRTYRKTIPFSMHFDEMVKIQSSEHTFHYPSDVKISHSHKCVCVADEGNKEIKFFNLISGEYLTSFYVDSCDVVSLGIEENFDGQGNDALYFGEFSHCFKYNVKDLLSLKGDAQSIWKVDRNYRYGMAIRKIGNMKQLFRFDFVRQTLDIIDTVDGKLIHELKLENITSVIDIIFITPTRMLLSELNLNTLFIYDEVNPNEWKLFKFINTVDDIQFSQPLGLAIDRNGGKLFLSDYDNKRLVTFDIQGNFISCHVSNSKQLNPFGLDFDELTGLLYIADQQDASVRIFK